MGSATFVSQSPNKGTTTGTRRAVPVRGDMILLAVAIVLSIFGIVMVDSASPYYSVTQMNKGPMYMTYRQMLWLAGGTVGAVVLALFDYHIWKKLAVPMMIGIIGMLIAVLVLKQVSDEELQRSFFGGSVQPSEFAKVAIIIYLSVWLNAKRDSLQDIQLGLIPLAAIVGVVGGLILIQPDISQAATIFALGVLLYFLAGGDLRHFVLFALVAILAGTLVLLVSSKGSSRLISYWYGLKNPEDNNEQIRIALEAVANGGIFGLGLGRSETKVNGLPVPHTDSIFAVLVEELGLVGGLVLVVLYGVFCWRGIRIAQQAPDMLGSVMAAALTLWVISEAVVNMAFIIGLLPVTGSALPFISYGGSSLVSTLAAVGILFSISRYTGKPAPENGERRTRATVDLRRRDRRRRVPSTHRP